MELPATHGTLMQYFEWNTPADGAHWRRVAAEAHALAQAGITALWLPPACKAAGGTDDVGYGVYDLYDLGEFNQKGSVRTKYGTRDEYFAAVDACHQAGLHVYADVVFNHKAGADRTQWVKAAKVSQDDRTFVLDGERWIQAWTEFTFEARKGKYSSHRWSWHHFDGVDWDELASENAIFKFIGRGKDWAQLVSREHGNYDYLMFADLDMNSPEVRTELTRWGEWFVTSTGVDGLRLDAVKHIQFSFFRDWLSFLRKRTAKPLFAVGEYWNPNDVGELHNYIEHTGGLLSLFDAPLHRNFFEASRAGGQYDMRRILDGTLMQQQPALAVTLVDNHDTQPGQSLESWVDWWFKPLAYALILLRAEGYPCLFRPDWYGSVYQDRGHRIELVPVSGLELMVRARKERAYGAQRDWFDDPNIIGWTREGVADRPDSGCAVLMSDGPGGSKWMEVGGVHAGRVFRDLLGRCPGEVLINAHGWGEFRCGGGSVSLWAPAARG